MEQQAQYRQGERVRYRNDRDQACQGTVQEIRGTGQSACYSIRNVRSLQLEEVSQARLEGRLS